MPGSHLAARVTPERRFELVEMPVPEPGPRQVRIQVTASGICHSDALVKEALWPGLVLPRVPGHEVIGTVDATGAEVSDLAVGDLVGIGWHGGHCFTCERCRAGDFQLCENGLICGISYDGGHAGYLVAPREAFARVPASLEPAEAAPLLCAGVTTFNSLRHAGAGPGDTVAVLGIGGLGHLAIQFSRHMGYRTVAVSGGAAKRDLALELGADEYVDASKMPVGEALARLGGARVILATAPDAALMSAAVDGLGANGALVVLGVPHEPIRVSAMVLVGRRARVAGWPSGHAHDSEDTLRFAALRGIRARIETFPLSDIAAAYEKVMANEVRFRAVLLPG